MNEKTEKMSGDEKAGFVAGFICGAVSVGLLVGCSVAGLWRYDAIKHNAAEYDRKTGEWHWRR